MIDELKAGIYDKVTNSSFIDYLNGGIYAEEYPQTTTSVSYPNIVYYRVTNTPYKDSHGYFEPVHLQFNIYVDDREVNSLAGIALRDFLEGQFTDLMDDAVLTVSGYGNLRCKREFTHPIPNMNEDRIKGVAIGYLIELEKI